MEDNMNDNNSEAINGCYKCGKIEKLYKLISTTESEPDEYWCVGCIIKCLPEGRIMEWRNI